MIYVDSSVALAHLLGETRAPPATLWRETLVSSRLLEYEIWNRLHAYGFGESHGEEARVMIGRVTLLELTPPILERALAPFPKSLRTLDALHLASVVFLHTNGETPELASYDDRLTACAAALGMSLAAL